MKPFQHALIACALVAAVAPVVAADAVSLPFRVQLRTDWVYTHYTQDVYDCWNDGVAARCGRTRSQIEGETEGRLLYERELSDVWELRAQWGAEAYHHNGWTERSARASGPAEPRPRWVKHFFDTWVGLNHLDYGTLRVGSGLNPFQQASGQVEGNTDLGGKELLERMVAYDSPLLWGDAATGVKMNMAWYDGARYRKARYEAAPEDKTRAVRARGLSVLLDGKLGGAVGAKLAFFRESYGARKFYGSGPLDGDYALAPGATASSTAYNEENPSQTIYLGSGARARSRGVALDLNYQGEWFRVGGQAMRNDRLPTDELRTANFAQDGFGTGYRSQALAMYFSAWHGKWSLWSKASVLRFRLSDPEGLNSSSDWLYANSTQSVVKAGGEVAYAFHEKARAVVGVEWMKRDFQESPLANGMCATGNLHPCYDPRGAKFFTGVRSNF